MKRAVLLAAVFLLAGCGRAKTVFDVQQGMTERQVTALAGSPATLHENCWFYRASKAGTSIDGITFCFAGGRVATIQTATHL